MEQLQETVRSIGQILTRQGSKHSRCGPGYDMSTRSIGWNWLRKDVQPRTDLDSAGQQAMHMQLETDFSTGWRGLPHLKVSNI